MTLLAAALSLTLTASPDVYAVIVGYNGGRTEPALPTLRYADDDALKFYRWFSTLAPEDHLTLLTTLDDNTQRALAEAGETAPPLVAPTRTALLAAIQALEPKLAGHDATVFFVFAGHGLPGRFLLQPETGEDAAFTGVELRAAISALPARSAELFLDACRAQSLFAERGAPDFSADVAVLERTANTRAMGILTASSSTQSAGEAASLGGGYFSHVLASGLAGAADADNDGTVRFGELAAFVAFHTERLFGQRPWFEAPGGDLRAAVVELIGLPGVTLAAPLEGRFRIRDAAHRVVVELNKPAGVGRRLALRPGRYVIERGNDVAEVTVARGRVDVRAEDFVAGTTASRGDDGPDGFSAPFSSDVVSVLSAGYHSGVEPSVSAPWRFGVDLAYAAAPAPFGLPSVENGIELGVRAALSTHFYAGLHAAFHDAQFASGSLDRAGAVLEGGARFRPAQAFELEPHVGIGLEALWRTGMSSVHADFSVPEVSGGLRLEVALAAGFSAVLDGRLAVSWAAVDGTRSPFVTPQAALGVSWKR